MTLREAFERIIKTQSVTTKVTQAIVLLSAVLTIITGAFANELNPLMVALPGFLGLIATWLISGRSTLYLMQAERSWNEIEDPEPVVITEEVADPALQHEIDELTQNAAVLQERLAETTLIKDNLQTAYTRFQTVLTSIPVPCIGCDLEGRVYEWNESAEKTFGWNLMELFEMNLADYALGEEDREKFTEMLRQAILTDEKQTIEFPTRTKHGQGLFQEWLLSPITGLNGKISSILITCVDVTQRHAEQARLEEMAFKDALTGLLNRRSYIIRLEETHLLSTEQNPTSVILMDVDKFKNFNDTHGHPAGDSLLREIGAILTDMASETFIPARYGGEEFIMLMPNSGLEEAFEQADKVRLAIESQTKELFGGATASFGVATCTDPEKIRPGELVSAADGALYRAKHAGRNQVQRAIISNQTAA